MCQEFTQAAGAHDSHCFEAKLIPASFAVKALSSRHCHQGTAVKALLALVIDIHSITLAELPPSLSVVLPGCRGRQVC